MKKILIIDDEPDVLYSFERLLEAEPAEVLTAANGDEGLKLIRKHKPDVVVMDIRMGGENGLDVLKRIRQLNPKQIVIMMTAYGTSQTAIEAMKRGAFDYVLKPFDIEQLKQLLRRALESSAAMRDLIKLPADAEDGGQTGLIGRSPAMQNVYKLVGQVAPTDATVLITGESGTGKELIARAIYSNSTRHEQPFMAINCAAIPENLLESELFGHEKGSFTGASHQRIGKFEQCDGGTLFLDEIGDMPPGLQSKLLRVLQDGEFFRVGGDAPIQTDVRVLAATNRDLTQAVKKKEFREDLYYRLNVVSVTIPPLRERKEDIPQLVLHFADKWKKKSKRKGNEAQISERVMRCLRQYEWPGNVRELENVIQRALVMAGGKNALGIADLPAEVRGDDSVLSTQTGSSSVPSVQPSLEEAMRVLFDFATQPGVKLLPEVERRLIAYALERTNGNQVQAAKLLGITRATLRKRLEH